MTRLFSPHLENVPQSLRPREVAEITTGHTIFVMLYVNAGTWSLMY